MVPAHTIQLRTMPRRSTGCMSAAANLANWFDAWAAPIKSIPTRTMEKLDRSIEITTRAAPTAPIP